MTTVKVASGHRHDTRGVDYTCYGCKDPSKASDKETRDMADKPEATAHDFPDRDHYDEWDAYAEEVKHWQDTHTHYSADAYPVTPGAKFWDYDLRVSEIKGFANDTRPYSDTGEISTWHYYTTGGSGDTLTGHMRQYGRMARYHGGKDAEQYPVGTNYSDLKGK